MNLGTMAMNGALRITGVSPSECLVSYPGNLLEGLTPLHRSSRCILQHKPTWQNSVCMCVCVCVCINIVLLNFLKLLIFII